MSEVDGQHTAAEEAGQSLQRLSIHLLESYKGEDFGAHRVGRKPSRASQGCVAKHSTAAKPLDDNQGQQAGRNSLPQPENGTIPVQIAPSTLAKSKHSVPADTPVDAKRAVEVVHLKLPLPTGGAARPGGKPASPSAPGSSRQQLSARPRLPGGDGAESSRSVHGAGGRTARSAGVPSPRKLDGSRREAPTGNRGARQGKQKGSVAAAAVQGGGVQAAGRSSVALRESLIAMLGARQQLACRIAEDTPTLVPPSDRPAIMQVLEQSPSQRGSVRELAPVLRVLQKVPFLAELDLPALLELSRNAAWVRYQFLEPGQVVFSQGDVGALFYIIASGKVTVTINKAGTPAAPTGHPAEQQAAAGPPSSGASSQAASDAVVVIVLEAGQTFGEKALTKAGLGKRTATVTTLTGCELLTLDIHQYHALLARLHEEDMAAKVEVLCGFEITAGWSSQQLREVAGVLTLRKFPADKVVLHQGWPSTSLYFIKSGEVRVVRHLPANERVRRLLSNSVMAAQFQPGSPLRDRLKETALTGTSPGGGQLSERSSGLDLYHHMLPYDEGQGGPEDVYVEIATLGPHEVFGEVGASEGEWRQASIITSTYTELLELSRHDLLTRIKGGCRVQLEALCEQYVPDEALLDSVAQSVEWQRYKHRLIAGVLSQSQHPHLGRLVDYHRQQRPQQPCAKATAAAMDVTQS